MNKYLKILGLRLPVFHHVINKIQIQWSGEYEDVNDLYMGTYIFLINSLEASILCSDAQPLLSKLQSTYRHINTKIAV